MGAQISKIMLNSKYITAYPLLSAAAIDFGVQWIGWAVSSYLQTEVFYDITGSSTFLLLTLLTLFWGNTLHQRQVFQSSAVSAWALRLGTFLFSRVLVSGRDRRFDKVRSNPRHFFLFWTIQGVWVWLTLLPTMILNLKRRDYPLTTRDYVGWSMWLVGFLVEAIADHQKFRFKGQRANRGKWIESGLWSICRHPNYLGEILLWIGLFLPASTVMNKTELLSVLSPAFVIYLLTNVSGIPLLERQGVKRWGHLPAYNEYKQRTATLIPFIW